MYILYLRAAAFDFEYFAAIALALLATEPPCWCQSQLDAASGRLRLNKLTVGTEFALLHRASPRAGVSAIAVAAAARRVLNTKKKAPSPSNPTQPAAIFNSKIHTA